MSINPNPEPEKDEGPSQNGPRRFLFDRSFDTLNGKTSAEKEKPKPIYTEEQMQALRSESYDAGFAEGNKALQDEEFLRLRALLLNVERHLNQLTQAGLDIWQNQLAEMQEVALVIARKILPAYTQKYGTLEIESILARIIAEMAHEPRLVIRVSPENFETMEQKIKDITLQKAYAGKVIVLSDDEFGASDCRVEWADGGIDRDLRALWYDIDRILEEGTGLDTEQLSSEQSEQNEEPEDQTETKNPEENPTSDTPAAPEDLTPPPEECANLDFPDDPPSPRDEQTAEEPIQPPQEERKDSGEHT